MGGHKRTAGEQSGTAEGAVGGKALARLSNLAWCDLLAVRFDHPSRYLPTPHLVFARPLGSGPTSLTNKRGGQKRILGEQWELGGAVGVGGADGRRGSSGCWGEQVGAG